MKTKIQQPEKSSHTVQSKPKAANQSSIQKILQRYQAQTLQMEAFDEDELLQGKFKVAQREELDDDELLQGKFSDTAQREAFDEDELLQGKFDAPSTVQREETSPLGGGRANRTGLPDALKSGFENLSGYSMDDVRVHYNSDKPAQLQALAYTQGTDIHVAPGQEKHLPHEAWHVVQQKQGRVQPTTQLQGININDNEGLEKEADVMGNLSLLNRNIEYVNISQLKKDNSSKIYQLLPSDYNSTINLSDTTYALIMGTQVGGDVNFMGHSGIMLEGYNSETHWYHMAHFFPEYGNASIKEKIKGVKGKIESKNEHSGAKNYFDNTFIDKVTYKINKEGKDAAQEKMKEEPPMYKLLTYNCATWASDVAKNAGAFWKIPVTFYSRPAAMMSWSGYFKSWKDSIL